MANIFTNGKARITRLVLFELICGVAIMVIGQVLGSLPSQDWLTPANIKKACFFLGTFQVMIKGCEMFFSKTVSLFQDYDKKQEQQIAAAIEPVVVAQPMKGQDEKTV